MDREHLKGAADKVIGAIKEDSLVIKIWKPKARSIRPRDPLTTPRDI